MPLRATKQYAMDGSAAVRPARELDSVGPSRNVIASQAALWSRSMNRRQTLLVAVGSLLAAMPRTSVGQRAAVVRHLAYLGGSTPTTGGPYLEIIKTGLRELGGVVGRNLIWSERWAAGDDRRYEALTRELLSLRPDVFLAVADDAAVHAARADPKLPVLFIYGADPVGRGLVDSLAKPGRNATGISTLAYEMDWKRMALLKEAIPSLSRLGMLCTSGSHAQEHFNAAIHVARSLRLELIPAIVDTPEDVDRAFEHVARSGAQAVMDFETGLQLFLARERIGALAIKHRLAMYGASNIADSGVLLSYGVNLWDLFRRIAPLVDRVLRGERPADIPVEQVNVYDLVVNLRTARALGLDLPRSILLRATRILE